jgi:hypothetical protein
MHSPSQVRYYGITHRMRENVVYKDNKTQTERLGLVETSYALDYLLLSVHPCLIEPPGHARTLQIGCHYYITLALSVNGT